MCSNRSTCALSKYVCGYYLTFPINYCCPIDHIGLQFLPHIMNGYAKQKCPMYAPYASDGICRYCGLDARKHRKYFLYSHQARKIQTIYLRYKLRTKIIPYFQALYPMKHVSIRGDYFFPFLYKRFYKNGYRHYHESKMHWLICDFFPY